MATSSDNIFLSLTAPGVAGLTPYQPGKPIETLEREYGVSNAIKLASNENPLGPSPRALEALARVRADLARYPDGAAFSLKTALARHLDLTPEQFIIGNGSNEILELVTRAFVTPENEVIFSEHAFAVYAIMTQAVGSRARVARALEYGHDLDAMAALVNDRTRLVFVANPNNPTGTLLDAASLENFLEGVPAHVLVVLDEAYFEYVTAADHPDGTRWLARFPNLLVARTFSKIYGLAGLRVGYAMGNPQLISLLERVRQPFNVNAAALSAAEAALEDDTHLQRSRELNTQGMAQILDGIRKLNLSALPSAGNFLAIDLGQTAAPIYEGLLRQGVIVRPVANYGMPDFLRVTIGLPDENARFLRALEQVLSHHNPHELQGVNA
ncbi:histidinol-phosphate transaminase [Thermithiobacillus plumbiphilus]|uniref:Histidinol-phosphate aminotransferase n=1 Tax=Thermithiobacillus plumbiphilus TaxID=1729899 RepID=A0ABU9D6M6_9PROT